MATKPNEIENFWIKLQNRDNWIYLFYSMPETGLDKEGKKIGENRVSRFTLNGDSLDPGSEKVLLRITTQREQCHLAQ